MYDLYNFKVEIAKQLCMPAILQRNASNNILNNLSFGTRMRVSRTVGDNVTDVPRILVTKRWFNYDVLDEHLSHKEDYHVLCRYEYVKTKRKELNL